MTKVLSSAQGLFSVELMLGAGFMGRGIIAAPARPSCISGGSDGAVSPER